MNSVHKVRAQIHQTERSRGASHASLVLLLYNLGSLLRLEENFCEAAEVLQRAIKLAECHCGSDSMAVAKCTEALARCYSDGGRYGKAISLLEKSLNICRSLLGRDHFSLCALLDLLVDAHTANGTVEEALVLCEESAKIAEDVYGHSHSKSATRYRRLAGLLELQGRHAEARPLHLFASAALQDSLFEDEVDEVEDPLSAWPNTDDGLKRLSSEAPTTSELSARGLASNQPSRRSRFFDCKAYGVQMATMLALVVGFVAGEWYGFGGSLFISQS